MTQNIKSKEELLLEVESLKKLNKQLLDTIYETEKLEFSWSGNLGQWFWDYSRNEVFFNPLKASTLGYRKEDLPESVTFQFFTDRIHPDDYMECMDQMAEHLRGNIPIWEVKYRIKALDGSWKVYHDRGKVTERASDGTPLFLKGIVFDVTAQETEKLQILESNANLKNQLKIDSLTGLMTRAAILFELGKAANRAKNFEEDFSIIMLRVDGQSSYEAEYGIMVSEEILRDIGQVIKRVAAGQYPSGRSRETVFTIVLPGTMGQEAKEVADAIRNQVKETFFTIPQKVTITAAISTFDPKETVSEFTERTRTKLLQAQREGRNRSIL